MSESTQPARLTFEDFNKPETYDQCRGELSYAYTDVNGNPARYTAIEPDDREDPAEDRGLLVLSGRVRVGFDPRTHKAWIKEGEVVIAPLSK